MPRRGCNSECRRLSKSVCQTKKRCRYIQGPKRQYCRIHPGYKCDAEENVFKVKPDRATRNTPIPGPTKAKLSLQNRMAGVIQKTVTKPVQRRRIQRAYLKNTICSDSGFCLVLGSTSTAAKIRDLFQFNTFSFLTGNVRKMSTATAGGTGVVSILEYETGHGEQDSYKATALLKSYKTNKLSLTDSLLYEYYVGLFVNKLTKRFPVFIQTYGFFNYVDDNEWQRAINQAEIPSDEFKRMLQPYENPPIRCIPENVRNCLLLEYIKDSKTLLKFIHELCKKHPTWARAQTDAEKHKASLEQHEFSFEILFVLYQVYFALSALHDQYTHYDLHTANVMMYKLADDEYITYTYHYDDNTHVTFKSQYVVKIIDYGRCFYRDPNNPQNSSERFYARICEEKSCDYVKAGVVEKDKCGKQHGFAMFNTMNPHNYYIDKKRSNVSHDLRLSMSITETIMNFGKDTQPVPRICHKDSIRFLAPQWFYVYDNVEYGKGFSKYIKDPVALAKSKRYGTMPNPEPYNDQSRMVHNVMNMEESLREQFTAFPDTFFDDNADKYHEIGKMDVYRDPTRSLQFVSTKTQTPFYGNRSIPLEHQVNKTI
jgi:hypothetical protein